MFEDLRAQKVIKAIRKDWYSFVDLDDAMCRLRETRDGEIKHKNDKPAKTVSYKGKKRPVGCERDQSDHLSTQELLRQIPKGSSR
jgi:hypothetical protein